MRKTIVTFGAAAMLALWPAAAQAASHVAPGASPACGARCFSLSSLVLGQRLIQNAYVAGDDGTGGRPGQPLNLHLAGNTRPNEDFTGARAGTLGDLCGGRIAAGSYVCLSYPASDPVFESDWSPFGNQSGLCAGLAGPGRAGEPVTLRRCGRSAGTLWVGDQGHSVTVAGRAYTPWVNASDPDYSHPLVLTVAQRTSGPARQLIVARLNLLSGGTVADTQQFTVRLGQVP